MIKKSLAIGIIFLFIISSITPMVLGNDIESEIQTQATTLSVGPMDSPWPMFGHDTRNTGRSPYNTTDNHGGIKWKFETDWLIETSPAIDKDGTIYIADWDYLYAINPNGTMKWCFKQGDITQSSPAIAEDGTIYYGTDKAKLYAINPNGTLKWRFSASGSICASPAIGPDGTIYFSTFNKNGRFYAVNPDGTEKWHYDADYYCQQSPAIANDGTVYFNSHVSLYSFYPNGTLIWKKKIGNPNFTFLAGPTIGDDEIIYISCDPGYLYAIYPNGTTKWRSSMEWSGWATPSIGIDGTIYVGYKYLYAFYPNGTIKWIFKLDETGSHHIDSRTYAVSSEGTIFVGTYENHKKGYIVAINPDGTEKWREKVSDYRVLSSPAIGVDGTIYIGAYMGTTGGALYALNGKKFEDPVIVKPESGQFYLFDKKLWKTMIWDSLCIGKITIEVFHPDPANVSHMEILVDGIKQCELISAPYKWTWTNRTELSHARYAFTIQVIAVNQTGMTKSDSMIIWRWF